MRLAHSDEGMDLTRPFICWNRIIAEKSVGGSQDASHRLDKQQACSQCGR